MSLLLETIKIEKRQIYNLEWHNARLNKSRNALLGINESLDLANIIKIPDDLGEGTYRCRVLYGKEIDEIQFLPHQTRIVRSLQMIHCDDIEYGYKYADRHKLEELFDKRGDCDEILIIKEHAVATALAMREGKADGTLLLTKLGEDARFPGSEAALALMIGDASDLLGSVDLQVETFASMVAGEPRGEPDTLF